MKRLLALAKAVGLYLLPLGTTSVILYILQMKKQAQGGDVSAQYCVARKEQSQI